MKRLTCVLPLLALLCMLLPVSVLAATSQKVGVSVRMEEDSASQIPGGYVWVRVGLYHTALADKNGLRSADITISYDENVFEASENLLMLDEVTGKEVWRRDTFTRNIEWVNANTTWPNIYAFQEFKVTSPTPLDVDPKDGKKEVQFKAEVTGNKYFQNKTQEPDDLLSFRLRVKNEALFQKSTITVNTKRTVLKDSKGKTVSGFYYRAAHLRIDKPSDLAVVIESDRPSADPFTVHVGFADLVFAKATYPSGDYIQTFATWSSSDETVITVSPYGDLKAVGIGTATIIAVSDEIGEGLILTTEKVVHVVADSVPVPIRKSSFPVYSLQAPAVDDTQISINGEDAGLARFISGNLYAPLNTIGTVLNAEVAFDTVKKMPTLNSQTVAGYKVVGQTTYLKLAELQNIFGAKLTYNSKLKLLAISI